MIETTGPARTLVTSADGTGIAVFVSGQGRPLVVLPGTTSDHTAWGRILPLLEPHATVQAVDRRGRGASGDRRDYSVTDEYADAAAVVDAAAAAAGGPVDLLGHSYGGNIAFGAAALTTNLRRLVLYEGWPPPDPTHRAVAPALLEHLDRLLARGEPAQLLETFYREVARMSPAEVSLIKEAPSWPARVAAAPTVPRELRAFGAQVFDPHRAARIAVPVLLLVGGDSPPEIKADPDVVAAALPDARIRILDGQGHVAHLTAPELLAGHVLSFLRE